MAPARWAAIRPWVALKGPNTKLHLAVDAHGIPVNLRVTAGTVADCTQAAALIDGIPLDAASAEYLLAEQ